MANAKEWLPKPYEAVCAENDKEYPLPFAKVQDADTTLIERMHLKYLGGVYIDIFPLDGVRRAAWRKECICKVRILQTCTLSDSSRSIQAWKRSQFMDTAIMQKAFTLTGAQESIRKVMKSMISTNPHWSVIMMTE